ncbi:putative Na+/H+ antiporter [Bordetella sp. FB-8]|uniref:putative Na+/H+ antiporter n=1 Tax=Bordetella sp. FB-8 TaxID=1159870 RepID=UPI00036CCB8C|nr:putative Na+/H+ antiporter [Bordetella sp. FB-8]
MSAAIEITATLCFALAVLHTFSVSIFARLAHRGGPHAGTWHLLAEVEVVFGAWAFVLLLAMAALTDVPTAVKYLDDSNFTEPLFVFAIMVVAASRPVLELARLLLQGAVRLLPVRRELGMFLLIMALVPLVGSLITEPAAMTLAAILLRDGYFRAGSARFKYLTLGVLFVNVSIGGVLTAYAAPPVLMVASAFNWDTAYMLAHFGGRAAAAVLVNAVALTWICRADAIAAAAAGRPSRQEPGEPGAAGGHTARPPVPAWVMAVHLLFLAGVVLGAHHPPVFLGLLMLFIGFCSAYKRYQSRLLIKEGLLVGFFLAGLVVLGGLQQWWLQDLLGGLPPLVLYWGAAALTALTDNAALTYLGSLVHGTGEAWRVMLVAGAVTGGGLTVIANAPNPAGFALLKGSFPGESISAGKLLLAALAPTLVAAAAFLLP